MRLMYSQIARVVVIFSLALLLLAGGTTAQEATVSPTSEVSSFDIPPEIAGNEQQWPLGNHDYRNTRAAVNASINASNVATLGVAWTVSLHGTGGWGAATGNPVIADNVVYFEDLNANIYAVDLETGSSVWTAQYNNQIFGPSGVGIGYGRLYAFNRVDRLVTLDIQTGAELWTYSTGFSLPAGAFQPSVFDNIVYAATQAAAGGQGVVTFHSYQAGASGVVIALNPETGEHLWEWWSVEEGFWGHPEINSGGGIWYPPGIDVETGVTYWATGNPAPFPGIAGYPNGSSRPGPNLYTNSVVALNHRTGEMLWYNQVTPHDLFNLDFQISPILTTVTIDGQERDIVVGSGKSGRVIGFDRATGERLWDTPIGLHQNDDLTEVPPDQTVWVAPGAWGGVETPMAYADGVVYALTANLPSPYHATAYDATNGEDALNRSEGGTLYETGTAEVDAIDAATGEILWTTPFDRVAFSGVTVVNDLLFTATLDGMIYALSREDGSIVWQYQAPGGTNATPAVAGDTLVWPIGIGDTPLVLALRLNSDTALPTPERQRTPVQTPQGT